MKKRNYPFNCWWVAASAEDVTREPACRWLLEQRVVLFRTEAGAVVALEDRCAHRWAPLSQGKLIGDDIVCPYYGLRYNTQGACTLVPSQSRAPAALKVRSYPVREHGTFVWIWMGDPGNADPALLPEMPWFTDPAYFQGRGCVGEVRCNYMAIHENLLDLTHVAHLHTDTILMEGWQGLPTDVKVTDSGVTFSVHTPEMPLTPMQALPMEIDDAPGKTINRVDWGTFASPACHISGIDTEDPAPAPGKRRHFTLRAMHCLTPITRGRCHYWWAVALDYGLKVPNLGELLSSNLQGIFKQDKDILEAIQTTIEQDVRADTAPEVLVAADRAPVGARRILKRMLEAESPIEEI